MINVQDLCVQVPIQVKVIWFLLHNMTTLININTWISIWREIWGYTPCICWHYSQPWRLWDDSCKKNSTDPNREEDDYYYILNYSSLSLFLLSLYIIITIIIIIIMVWSHLHHCDTAISVGHPMEIYPIGCFLYGLYVSSIPQKQQRWFQPIIDNGITTQFEFIALGSWFSTEISIDNNATVLSFGVIPHPLTVK